MGRCSRGFILPGGLVVKNPPDNAGDIRDVGSIPGLGRSPGGGHGNPLQSCLENPMDRGALQATVHGVAQSQTRLNDLAKRTWAALTQPQCPLTPAPAGSWAPTHQPPRQLFAGAALSAFLLRETLLATVLSHHRALLPQRGPPEPSPLQPAEPQPPACPTDSSAVSAYTRKPQRAWGWQLCVSAHWAVPPEARAVSLHQTEPTLCPQGPEPVVDVLPGKWPGFGG